MQIYLTYEREKKLRDFCRSTGNTISSVIGEMIDSLSPEPIKSPDEQVVDILKAGTTKTYVTQTPESYDKNLVDKNLQQMPKTKPLIIEGAFKTGLTKKRGEIHGDDYV